MSSVLRPAAAPVLLLGLLLSLVSPSRVAAHAVVLESSPVHDAVLVRAPQQVTLRFNSRIEKRFTRVTLAHGAQAPVPVAAAEDDAHATPDRLTIPLGSLEPGVYILRYRVLAVDGHITEGALRFTVATQ